MPLWYIYYRVLRECRQRSKVVEERMLDVTLDLRNKAMDEYAPGKTAINFYEFMEKVSRDEPTYTQHGLETLLNREPWFNPVKQEDTPKERG